MSDFASRRTLLTAAAAGAASASIALLGASPAVAAPAFADVPTGHQFYRQISWAHDKGISTGWGTGSRRTFRPDEHINRDALAAFLYRMAGSPSRPAPTRAPFRDVQPSMKFSKEISWLASTGISQGWPDGTFRPLQPVERGAMAAFLYRYSDLGLRTKIPLATGSVSPFVRDAEAAILKATNNYRQGAGARALSRSAAMDDVARSWSTTMATTGNFEHNPRYSELIPGAGGVPARTSPTTMRAAAAMRQVALSRSSGSTRRPTRRTCSMPTSRTSGSASTSRAGASTGRRFLLTTESPRVCRRLESGASAGAATGWL